MGLDMMAYARSAKPEKPVDFLGNNATREAHGEMFFSWRKHPNLHGWMWRLYREKSGTAGDPQVMGGFNTGNEVELTTEDLDRLQRDIADDDFYEPGKVSGFFFDKSRLDDRKDDVAFIEQARAEIAAGRFVYYTSWW